MKTKQQFVTEEAHIWIVSPHEFVRKNQQELLPDWNTPINLLILVLQKSDVSLRELNQSVVREKDRLRLKFIRFGLRLCFAWRDRKYPSDIFDPRTGYPLLSQQGKYGIDDNVTVSTLLNYPTTSYQQCSLIQHPDWGDFVYPSTLATSAPLEMVKSITKEFLTSM